jgi:redox-sensitive bicupin YhaK (pirin superfamily)
MIDQIWIETKTKGLPPRYDQKPYPATHTNTLELLVGPKGTHSLWINQDAYISRVFLKKDTSTTYNLFDSKNGVYIFVGEGKLTIEKHTLGPRDAVQLSDTVEVTLTANSDSEIYLFEIPLK